jgi:hypothetical protein
VAERPWCTEAICLQYRRRYLRSRSSFLAINELRIAESKPPGIARWCLSWILGAPVFWIPIYFLLFRLLLRIPYNVLYLPAAVHITGTALLAPLAFEGRRRYVSSNRQDSGMLYCVFAGFSTFTLLCWTYYGLRAAVIPSGHVTALYTIVVACGVLGPLGGYYLSKLIFSKSSA